MSYQTVLTSLLIDSLPFLIVIAWCIFREFEKKLPATQREALQHFVALAVTKVEQVYIHAGSNEKKQLAMQIALALFQEYKLPPPAKTVLDIAIESTVYAMNQQKQRAQAPMQDMVQQVTTELPIVRGQS